MKISDTISVNPSKNTLGHVEAPSIFRSPVIGIESSPTHLDLVKLLFPTAGAGVTEFRKYALPMRTLFATILIVTGLTMLSTPFGTYTQGFAICNLCFGGLLALGFLTRPVMAGAAIYFCITGALGLRNGITDMTVFCLMFGCIIFCIVGAGKYSCDTLIRASILRYKRKTDKQNIDNFMGYKAFHKVGL